MQEIKELVSNLVFEKFRSCGDLVGFSSFNSVFECDARDAVAVFVLTVRDGRGAVGDGEVAVVVLPINVATVAHDPRRHGADDANSKPKPLSHGVLLAPTRSMGYTSCVCTQRLFLAT